jgi:hypothetical protein
MATPQVSVYLKLADKNTGASASILRQKEYYDSLAENYERNGMTKEAEVFFGVAEELATLQKQIFGKSKKQKVLRENSK